MQSLRVVVIATALVAAAFAAGCTPDYPNCETDKNCADKKEFCVAGKCQQCRDAKDCPSGTKCWKGTCDNRKHCTKEDDCAQNEDCTNGVCTTEKPKAPPPSQCTLGSVYFDFNEAALTTEASSTL